MTALDLLFVGELVVAGLLVCLVTAVAEWLGPRIRRERAWRRLRREKGGR